MSSPELTTSCPRPLVPPSPNTSSSIVVGVFFKSRTFQEPSCRRLAPQSEVPQCLHALSPHACCLLRSNARQLQQCVGVIPSGLCLSRTDMKLETTVTQRQTGSMFSTGGDLPIRQPWAKPPPGNALTPPTSVGFNEQPWRKLSDHYHPSIGT